MFRIKIEVGDPGQRAMKARLSLAVLLLLTCVSCGSQSQDSKVFKLPSGKEIKITGIRKMDFPKSDSALVMNYLTDLSIDDKVALRKEVDEIWSVFQKDVENAQLKAGVIRATHLEGSGLVNSGKGYGFVFVKHDDGSWHCLDDKQSN